MNLAKKGFAIGLALILCVNFTLPVKAAGHVCPSCRGTNTMSISETTESIWLSELCIHGHSGARDNVGYLVHYPRIFCGTCEEIKTLSPVYEEKSRICSIA